jgi:mono/diheme cytochrome c family protein
MLTAPLRSSRWTIALLACILTLPQHRSMAQATDSTRTSPLTSFSGVYTAAQATVGRNIYLEICSSCHTPGELNDKKFWDKWVGSTIADLFVYLRDYMPKDNPYSLGDEDYANVTAYLLQLNSMPAGERAMPSDSTALAKIRITKADTLKDADTRRNADNMKHQDSIKKRTAP